MVDGPPDDGQLPNRDEGPRGLYKKRYNVAVSRARNQLWVVHSLDPSAHLKPRDLRRRLIEHARDPQALLRAMEVQGKRTDSIFEKLVLQRLLAARYRVETQWPVGAYRIDLVVEGKTRRLAVECDGEKWHTAEQLEHDIDREAVLRRLGWTFVHIRGGVFFRDPDAAMGPVFVKLDQLGIEPLGGGVAPPDPGGVVERVRRQAETLRAQWQREKEDAAVIEEEATSHRKEAAPPTLKASVPIRVKLPEASTEAPSLGEKGRAGADDHHSPGQSPREVQGRLPGVRPSNVRQVASSEDRRPIAQPAGNDNRVLEELRALDPRFRDPRCSQCGQTAHLAITNEGIVVTCKKCPKIARVDTDTLQHLVDRLATTCFRCRIGKLKSMARSFGNILKCQNGECGANNSWQGLSERLRR